MDISDFSSSGTTAAAAPASGTATLGGTALTETFDDFLVLLTTQLQYQDPLSPIDANQFTEQLVQFSIVEQAIATNSKLDDLIALQGGSQLSAAVSYIGHDIQADGEMISLQDGTATVLYGLESNTANTTISIINDLGRTVRVLTGETSAGLHELAWDGKDDSGADMPDGIYGIAVTAVDAEGQALPASAGTRGRVTGVESQDGQVYLKLGELLVPLEQVFVVEEIEDITAAA